MAEGFPSTALCCQHQAGIFRSTNRPWASSPCGITLPECLGNPHPQSWTWIFVFSQKLWTWFLTWLLYFFFLKGNPLICGFKVISEGLFLLQIKYILFNTLQVTRFRISFLPPPLPSPSGLFFFHPCCRKIPETFTMRWQTGCYAMKEEIWLSAPSSTATRPVSLVLQ